MPKEVMLTISRLNQKEIGKPYTRNGFLNSEGLSGLNGTFQFYRIVQDLKRFKSTKSEPCLHSVSSKIAKAAEAHSFLEIFCFVNLGQLT